MIRRYASSTIAVPALARVSPDLAGRSPTWANGATLGGANALASVVTSQGLAAGVPAALRFPVGSLRAAKSDRPRDSPTSVPDAER